MAIINSYPLSTPLNKDLLIGTEVYDTVTGLPGDGSRTVTFSISSIIALISTATGAQSLQQVTNIDQVSGVSISTNNVKFSGQFLDSAGTVGTVDQILTSNATGNLIWSAADAGGTVTSVAVTHAGNAFVAAIGNVATVNPSVDITMNGGVTQYIDGAGNLTLLSTLPDTNTTYSLASGETSIITLTAASPSGTSAVTLAGAGGTTVAGTGDIITITSPAVSFTSLTTTGTSGDAATLSVGVLNIPTPVIPFTSLTTTGSGVATLTTGVLNIPDYTYTEIDTLQSVCARGNSTSTAINMTGSGASGYLYVAGNSASANPTNVQGMAFAYNNSGGSRENELFFNPGSVTAAANDGYYFAIINEYLDSAAGDARVTDSLVKLYGDGELELVGATPTIRNNVWRMPTTAAPNTGYYLSKAAATIDLEWTAPTWTQENVTISAVQLSALNSSPITLLGTPGVGKAYFVNQAFFWFEAGGVVYDFPGFIEVINLGVASKSITAGDLNSASSSLVATTLNSMRDVANLPVTLANPGANPTQGDGVLYISISYQVKTLGPTIQAG